MDKDSFFTPIDLPDIPTDQQTADPSEPNWPTPDQFRPILDKISDEISKIQQGTSKLTPHGISFTTGIQQNPHGFMVVLGKFKSDPTKENMTTFLDMCEQDVNLRARREFQDWLNIIIKETK